MDTTNFKFVLDSLWGEDYHDEVAKDWGYSDREQMIYYETLTMEVETQQNVPHELDKVDAREIYSGQEEW